MDHLCFNDVSHSYRTTKALSHVNLQIKAGEIVGLIGANGAGKSTLMNLASGLRTPSQGSVKIFGRDPIDLEVKYRRRVLPQEVHFPVYIKVKEIIETVAAHDSGYEIESLIDRLEMSPLLNRLTSELSGGERRKLGIICSLLGAPDLVLLDEPTANVDLLAKARIREILLEYFKCAPGKSLLFSSHSMSEVELLAERVIVLFKGRIVADSRVQDLRTLTGMKKVKFESLSSKMQIGSANRLSVSGTQYVAYGTNSDDMLKEVIGKDPQARNFEVGLPNLEEAIMQLWSERSAE